MRALAIVRGALVAAVASIATLAPVATAQAPTPPAERFAVGSPAMLAAQAIARAHWGVDPCGGNVEVAWVPLDRHVNGISSWTVTGGAYEDPASNGDCRIELNTEMAFGWQKFCTVLVHEYGHLAGHDHDAVPERLMSAVYTRPLAACVPATRRARAAARRTL